MAVTSPRPSQEDIFGSALVASVCRAYQRAIATIGRDCPPDCRVDLVRQMVALALAGELDEETLCARGLEALGAGLLPEQPDGR